MDATRIDAHTEDACSLMACLLTTTALCQLQEEALTFWLCWSFLMAGNPGQPHLTDNSFPTQCSKQTLLPFAVVLQF